MAHSHSALKYTFDELHSGLEKSVSDGQVDSRDDGHLRVYKYRSIVSADWKNPFMIIARGIVLDLHEKRIAALPFEKFFNYSEHPPRRWPTIASVEIKYDGSLGIAYYDKYSESWRMNTPGSFCSPQAVWGTAKLQEIEGLSSFPHNMTFLFEIICPDSTQVVEYDEEHLRLITAFDIETGEEQTREYLSELTSCPLTDLHDFDSVKDIIKSLESMGVNQEGWVVKFTDGTRRKFKGSKYIVAHRLKSNITKKGVRDIMANFGEDTDAGKAEVLRMADMMPEEHYVTINMWIKEMEIEFNLKYTGFKQDLAETKDMDDKELGMTIKNPAKEEHHFHSFPGLRTLLFMARKDIDVTRKIWMSIRV